MNRDIVCPDLQELRQLMVKTSKKERKTDLYTVLKTGENTRNKDFGFDFFHLPN